MRRARRAMFGLVVLAAGLGFGMPDAGAGGASFFMNQPSYEPGDWAVGRTGINWAHNPQLGAPEDGPYFVFLVPMASMETVASWPIEAGSLPGAVFVDVIEITEGPIEVSPGFRMGPHGATIEFEVPDLPDGQYALTHCNRPCTTPLADITGGGLWIGPPQGVVLPPLVELPSTTTTAPTTTTTAPTTTAAPTTASTVTGLATGGSASGPVDDASGLPADLVVLLVPAAIALAVAALLLSRPRVRST